MSKRFLILFSVLILSCGIFGGVIYFSDGNKNLFTQTTSPAHWTLQQTVGKGELYLPEGQYQIGPAKSSSSFGLTTTEQQFLPSSSPSATPYMTISYLEPSFWLGWSMQTLEPQNSKLLQRSMESYQKTYRQDREKEGLQVQWNSEKVAGMEQIPTPMKIVGLNLVLYLEGTLASATGQTFVHQHYCWIEKDRLYLITFLYPKPLEKQTQPVVNQIITHFKIN